MRLLSTAIPALAIGLLASPGVRADGCQAFDALIRTHFVLDPQCMEESPFGFCTEGTVDSGPLAGTTRFTVKTLKAASDAPTTLLYTGVLVITTGSGTVTIHDRGMLDTLTGLFFEFDKVVAGTRRFDEVRGSLTSQGTQTLTPPGFLGRLAGHICQSDGEESTHGEHSERPFDDEDSDE
jgi:hypothetical protein